MVTAVYFRIFNHKQHIMALSRIWSAFIIIAILTAGVRFFSGSENRNIFSSMVSGKTGDTLVIEKVDAGKLDALLISQIDSNKVASDGKHKIIRESATQFKRYDIQSADGIFETCQTAVTLCLKLIGFLALFMGLLAIAEKAGGINFLARIIGPFFSRIFPDVPKNHPAMGHMIMNFSANMLGLDNAATPFGLKAMESLQELNPEKSRASNSQIMFLALHASGLTLIPISIIALRSASKAASPMDIFVPCMIDRKSIQFSDNVPGIACFRTNVDTYQYHCPKICRKGSESDGYFRALYDCNVCRNNRCHGHCRHQTKNQSLAACDIDVGAGYFSSYRFFDTLHSFTGCGCCSIFFRVSQQRTDSFDFHTHYYRWTV